MAINISDVEVSVQRSSFKKMSETVFSLYLVFFNEQTTSANNLHKLKLFLINCLLQNIIQPKQF